MVKQDKRAAVLEWLKNNKTAVEWLKNNKDKLPYLMDTMRLELKTLNTEKELHHDISKGINVPTAREIQLSRLFEKTGELYKDIDEEKAREYLSLARRYNPYPNVKRRITDKISSLTSLSDSLESRATGYLAIISLASAFLSISLKWTGAVVGNSFTKANWISLCLFMVGCLFTFFYFRAKKK